MMRKIIGTALATAMFISAVAGQPALSSSAAITVTDVPDGMYMIRNVNSGLYLDVENGVASSGTNVQQWGAEEANFANVWTVTSVSDGDYILSSHVDGDYVLTVDSMGSLVIDNETDNDNQRFFFSATDEGNFTILTRASGYASAVEVVNAETTYGADVQQWILNGFSCQEWELIPVTYTDLNTLEATPYEVQGDEFIAGDMDDNSAVSGIDLVLLRNTILTDSGLNDHQLHTANVNGDDSVTLADTVRLQQYLLGMDARLERMDVPISRVYAAIDGEYSQGISETVNAGYVSDAYLNLDNATGVTASWNVTVETDGVYAVTIRYANGGTDSRLSYITVNNALVYYPEDFVVTGSWTNWEEVTLYLPLTAGVNHLALTSQTDDGAPNLDTITIEESDMSASASYPLESIIGTSTAKPSTGTNDNNVYGEGRQVEDLSRGVVAAYTGSGMLVSWRSLATDADNTTFKLYKNGEFVADIGVEEATCYFVEGATGADSFTIDTYVNGVMTEWACPATILGTKNGGTGSVDGAYMDVPLNTPADQTMPDGSTCSYSANDCSVGDVDGDGDYEIIVKWDPSNSQDNSQNGYTGTVFLDCYKLDGTQLWRIDLGVNIRAGAHYTQFMVYDFDGDGLAELMCKTADGTVDGTGKIIGEASMDYRGTDGRILSGPEYLTLFDGQTGAALDTIDYEPSRGNVSDWGDNYGNRCDRFLAGVAYLDGQTPSAVFCRGYYTRVAIAAYDVVDKKIVQRWIYDTGYNANDPVYGQGDHSICVLDVDNDGKDEIVYGSACIDDDGMCLWSTGLGHGDCMQAGDLIPEHKGMEIYQVHEDITCAEIHDAATGEILWKIDATEDVGRGIALNISADYPGMEFSCSANNLIYYWDNTVGTMKDIGVWGDGNYTGTSYSSNLIKWSQNSAVWWDGTLEREALDRTMVENFTGRLFTGNDISYNNGTKANACLTCDLFGDWREEMIFPTSDGSALRIFETTAQTDVKLFTLMHDTQYRTGVAIENVGYNQAPNTSFFLGTGYDLPENPTVYTPSAN